MNKSTRDKRRAQQRFTVAIWAAVRQLINSRIGKVNMAHHEESYDLEEQTLFLHEIDGKSRRYVFLDVNLSHRLSLVDIGQCV